MRFSSLAGEASLDRHTEELEAFLCSENIEAPAAPVYAFYKPLWRLPCCAATKSDRDSAFIVGSVEEDVIPDNR